MRPTFRIYAHRGAAAHHPENTRRSFAAAVEAGADALETDVRMTADGEIVVFHDADGSRTCEQSATLASTVWSDVAQWDAGEGEHPMLLSEMLETWPEHFVNIDIKDDSVAAARATLKVVRAAGRQATVGLGSFHRTVAAAVREEGWTGQMALVPREVAAARLLPSVLSRLALYGNAAQIPTHQGMIRLDGPGFIARCHRLGLRVDYWTIDDPEVAKRLVHAGCDGIVTNDPGLIREALGR